MNIINLVALFLVIFLVFAFLILVIQVFVLVVSSYIIVDHYPCLGIITIYWHYPYNCCFVNITAITFIVITTIVFIIVILMVVYYCCCWFYPIAKVWWSLHIWSKRVRARVRKRDSLPASISIGRCSPSSGQPLGSEPHACSFMLCVEGLGRPCIAPWPHCLGLHGSGSHSPGLDHSGCATSATYHVLQQRFSFTH